MKCTQLTILPYFSKHWSIRNTYKVPNEMFFTKVAPEAQVKLSSIIYTHFLAQTLFNQGLSIKPSPFMIYLILGFFFFDLYLPPYCYLQSMYLQEATGLATLLGCNRYQRSESQICSCILIVADLMPTIHSPYVCASVIFNCKRDNYKL